jgi:hypothetical protein
VVVVFEDSNVFAHFWECEALMGTQIITDLLKQNLGFSSMKYYYISTPLKKEFFIETNALALMVAASSCAGVRHKRYSGQQD